MQFSGSMGECIKLKKRNIVFMFRITCYRNYFRTCHPHTLYITNNLTFLSLPPSLPPSVSLSLSLSLSLYQGTVTDPAYVTTISVGTKLGRTNE